MEEVLILLLVIFCLFIGANASELVEIAGKFLH